MWLKGCFLKVVKSAPQCSAMGPVYHSNLSHVHAQWVNSTKVVATNLTVTEGMFMLNTVGE